MRQHTGDDTARDRRGLGKLLQGLSWWQVVLVLAPLAMAGIGGALGGGIGGAAFAANLSLTRRPWAPLVRFLAMITVCALAFGVFFVLEYGIRSALTTSSAPAPSPSPSPVEMSTAAQSPSPMSTCTAKTWAPQPVTMNPPTVLHATGAELSWPAYVNITCDPANDLAAYEVFRGTSQEFTPSSSTLVATVKANRTSFVDTSAPAGSGRFAGDYFYLVDVLTRSGQLVPGTPQFAQLPKRGQTELVLQADAATTLNSAYPDSLVDPNGFSISVMSDIAGHGAERAIFEFGPLTAIPRDAYVSDARLSVWCNGSDPSHRTVYGLTRTFDSSVATWNTAATGVKWTHPGGDYTTPSGAPLLSTDPGWCDFEATSIVQGWTSTRGSEHGLLLKADDETESAAYGNFSAGNMSIPGQRPELIVIYE